MVSQFSVNTHFFEVGLTQNPVDHETLSISFQLGLYVGLVMHSNFLGPQALV